MIRRMLAADIINQLKEKAKLRKQALKIKKTSGENSPEFKEIKEKINNLKDYYLEEDCSFLKGGGFRKGKDLSLGEVERLLELGFHLVWVTDEPITEDSKKNNIIYNYKRDFEKILVKSMVVLDESNTRKPGSTIKILEGNDLIKQTIEALQMDGARYLAQSIFGLSAGIIDNVRALASRFYAKAPDKVDIFDNTCLGNIYKLKEIKDNENVKEQDKSHDEERTNYFLRIMINMGLAFITTLSKIQNYRLNQESPEDQKKSRRPDPSKRHPYSKEEIEEGYLGAIFAVYGFLHSSIDKLIIRLTKPFYDDNGKLSGGNGFLKLNDRNRLLYEKHCNVSYNFFASFRERGFVGDIARGILQYHQRWLDNSGYPKRKMSEEKNQVVDKFGNTMTVSKNVYEQPINELTRLASIIEFFLEYLFHTPFHIPFQRDNLVRYLMLNSTYPLGSDNKPDKNGIFDIQTNLMQEKPFDGYLVDQFIRSINIYKINEIVPIYNFNNTNKKLYDATVIRYNELPHRPVLKIIVNSKNQELDLSKPENESLYISEYFPSLRFQTVIERYHLDQVSGGISLSTKQKEYSYDTHLTNKYDKKTENALSEIFDSPQVIEQTSNPDVDINSLIASTLPPELGKTKINQPAKKDNPPQQVKITDEIKNNSLYDIDTSSPLDTEPPSVLDVKETLPTTKKNKKEDNINDLPLSDIPFEPIESIAKEEILTSETFDNQPLKEKNYLIKESISNETKPIDTTLEKPTSTKKTKDTINTIDSDDNIKPTANTMQNTKKQIEKKITPPVTKPVEQITKKLFSVYIKIDNKLLPYGLGSIMSSKHNEKKVKIDYLAQITSEDSSAYTYHYSLLSQQEQHIITVYNPTTHSNLPLKTLKFFIAKEFTQNKKEQIVKKTLIIGEYYLLYYIQKLDPSNKNNVNNIKHLEGIPKYIVRIKEVNKQSNKSIVTFIRYIKIKDNKIECLKDKNCGKSFDLSKMPFFQLNRPLSAKDLVHFLNLSIM